MKKALLSLFTLVLLLNTSPTTLLAEEDNFENISLRKESFTYQMALESVVEQLTEQDALRLLPIYIDILKKDFENTSLLDTTLSSTQSSFTAYFPNGGNIFYSNYMGYGAEVNQVYLSKSETSDHFNGTVLTSRINFIFSLPFEFPYKKLVSVLLAANTYYTQSFRRTVDNGTGRIKIVHSADKYDSASVTLHWSSAPYAPYTSGARVRAH